MWCIIKQIRERERGGGEREKTRKKERKKTHVGLVFSDNINGNLAF